MDRFVDVVSGKGEKGRHVPQDVRRVVRVHVLENTDFAQNILSHVGADTKHVDVQSVGVLRGARGVGVGVGVSHVFHVHRPLTTDGESTVPT